jgi:hypothetical protein
VVSRGPAAHCSYARFARFAGARAASRETPAPRRGCRANPRRPLWSRCKGGFRKPRAARHSRPAPRDVGVLSRSHVRFHECAAAFADGFVRQPPWKERQRRHAADPLIRGNDAGGTRTSQSTQRGSKTRRVIQERRSSARAPVLRADEWLAAAEPPIQRRRFRQGRSGRPPRGSLLATLGTTNCRCPYAMTVRRRRNRAWLGVP